jgi:hypothetical protein
MGPLVLVEGVAPGLELEPLGTGEKERLREGDRGGPVRAMGVDAVGTYWKPFTSRGVVLE